MVGEDGRGMVWPDDVPAEVARQAQGRGDNAARKRAAQAGVPSAVREATSGDGKLDPPKRKRPRKRPVLSAVPDGDNVAVPPLKSSTGRGVPSPVRPVVTPPQPTRIIAGQGRKKRELPPSCAS